MISVTAWQTPLDSSALTDAEISARIAAEEFTDAIAKHGRDAALRQFNRRVSFWANRFTNVRYRRYVYTLASFMNGETHSFRVSQAALMAKYRKQHPGKKVPCHSTIQNYNEAMAAAGIFDVIHHRQGSEDENPGAYETTEYRVHFGRVLVDGQVMPHDFTEASSAEPDIGNIRTKTSDGFTDGFTDGSGDGFTDVLFSDSSPTSSLTSSHTAEDEETLHGEDLGGDEETVKHDKSPAHLLRRNTFKVWTGKSGQAVWYNLDRATKAPADARVVALDPISAQYFWKALDSYDARREFLVAPPGARAEQVDRWYNAAKILDQEIRELEEVVRLEERQEAQAARRARQEAQAEAERIRAEAKAQAEEDARKLASGWVPTLDGVDLHHHRKNITDDPRPFYIDVATKGIRLARGLARPSEAKVLIKRTVDGPVLVSQTGAARRW